MPTFKVFKSKEEEDMNPPSYDESIARSHLPPSPNNTTHSSDLLQHQLQSLILQINDFRTQSARDDCFQNQQALNHITAETTPFFASFAESGLQKGTLYLIPPGCISAGAKLADLDLRGRDEFVEVVVVRDRSVKEGVALRYWRNEDLARLYARQLQPRPAGRLSVAGTKMQSPVSLSPSPSNSEESKSSWWSRKWNSFSTAWMSKFSPPFRTNAKDRFSKDSRESEEKVGGRKADVAMTVGAEEVVFRSQNEYGLWRTESGFAIVMRFVVTF